MKIKSIHILLAITIIIGGGILLASELDLYNTTRTRSPRKTIEGHMISLIRGVRTLWRRLKNIINYRLLRL